MDAEAVVSIDTNVLVRFLVADTGASEQCRLAKDLFMQRAIFIPESVLLETEWVLRAVYDVPRPDLCEAFAKLLRLRRVLVPDPSGFRQALLYYAEGFDFADAWHLIRSDDYEMKTFDKNFLKKARKAKKTAAMP